MEIVNPLAKKLAESGTFTTTSALESRSGDQIQFRVAPERVPSDQPDKHALDSWRSRMKIDIRCPHCGETVALYRNPIPTADIIIRVGSGIVLIKRKNPPHGWAIPGGFIDYGETAESAALREALEETSLNVRGLKLFGVYSDPERDPRHHTIAAC